MTHSEATQTDTSQVVTAFLEHLEQAEQNSQRNDLLDDGSSDASALATSRRMRQFAKDIRLSFGGKEDLPLPGHIPTHLKSITDLCDQKFVAFTYSDIPVIWRSIFVDAQLLKACCALRSTLDLDDGTARVEQAASLRLCIRDLDLALIVAGAASLGKGQVCHDLISALQEKLLVLDPTGHISSSATRSDELNRPRKRAKLSAVHSAHPLPSSSTQADSCVSEYTFEKAPSFVDLAGPHSKHRSSPFVVRAFAQGAGWPAVETDENDSHGGSWTSFDHLVRVAGPARIVPVEVGANYAREDWGQDVMLWSEFLQHCGWDEPEVGTPVLDERAGQSSSSSQPVVYYMAQHDLVTQFPALERDYMLPDYVYTSPPPPSDWPHYRPPATADGVTTNLWIGPAGTVSPPHHDPFYNCFVQAVGHKEVWVAPPHCRPVEQQQHDAKNNAIAETLMSNTANLDVFDSKTAVPASVRAAALKATLGPGDLLYMPPGWWHSLRSLSRSFSVSMWF